METARLQQQREEEAEARRQARAAEKAAEKSGFQRKPLVAPVAAAAKEETPWRRSRPEPAIPAARPESPAPAVGKYRPPIAAAGGGGGGWRAKLEAKQAAAATGGGGGGAAAAPAVVPPSTQASVPMKEESKLDEDGFQTVPVRGAKEVWRPRRGR